MGEKRMNGVQHQKTFAAKGSQLYEAIVNGLPSAAKQQYTDTTTRFDALYPAGDRQWFENWSRMRSE
jgi:hypothetical protein